MSTRGRKATPRAIVGALKVAPAAPDHLPADMAGEWSEIAAELQARGLLTASVLGVVATYLVSLWTVRQAQGEIARRGVLVAGAGGALKPNPANALLVKSQDTAARLAAELGLTPAARSKAAMSAPAGKVDDAWSDMDL